MLLAVLYIFGCTIAPAADLVPMMEAHAEETITIVTVTASVLYVRIGPGTGYEKIGSVTKDSAHTVIGSDKASDGVVWYKINYNGQPGYISGNYCELSTITADPPTTAVATTTTTTSKSTAASSSTTPSQPAQPAEQVLLITGSVVSVRLNADIASRRVDIVRRGDTYSVIETTKDSSEKLWYKISTGSAQGYVCSDYAELTDALSTEISTITVAGAIVNLRIGAGSEYQKVGSVRKGDTFNILGSARDSDGVIWYRIEAAGVGGYISSEFVTVQSGTTTTTTTTTTIIPTTTTTKAVGSGSSVREVTTGVVTTQNTSLNVRSGAGTTYGVIGNVNNGSTVTILGSSNGWYKIVFNSSNGYGYVSASYITNVKTQSTLVTLAFGTEYYYVNVGSTVKLSASASGYTVTYSSANPTNAPINSTTGVVTGKVPGMYTITAKSGDMTATAQVVVLKAPYTGIQHMTLSDEGIDFIAQWEGGGYYDASLGFMIFEPYKDSAGFWTVGYGHAKTTTESKSWSYARAVAEFNKDIEAMIGAEHIMTDEKPYLTKEEAFELLKVDLNDGVYVAAVSKWAVRNGVKLSQQQFDALVSFCFNMGPSYWTSDTKQFYLKSAILCQRSGDDADPNQIVHGFTLYIKAGGMNLRGLWWRRRNEAEMFTHGDYAIDRENKFTLPNITWGG